jgi:hypothetical protein
VMQLEPSLSQMPWTTSRVTRSCADAVDAMQHAAASSAALRRVREDPGILRVHAPASICKYAARDAPAPAEGAIHLN